MISTQLATTLKPITDLTNGYVYHPMVIRVAIDEALRTDLGPVNVTSKVRQSDTCVVEGCDREPHGNSLCHAHYRRHLRGTLTNVPVRTGAKRPKRKHIVKRALIAVMGGKCMLCGVKYPDDVYDFHHVFEKEHDNFSSIFTKFSAERIALEVSKCALLCANCHRLEHSWIRI